MTSIEFQLALKTLKNGKTAGYDNTTPEQLKYIEEIEQILLPLFNMAYTSGQIPNLWHILTLIPFPKKGDLTKCKNY
jgi:hypothetical protein